MPQEETNPVPPGLVIGIVTDNDDPEGLGRVKVKYPWFSPEHASDWARVLAVGGGPNRGVQFMPEINDEVLIGFELGDMHHPYVLGGLWNGLDKPPLKTDKAVSGGKVWQRAIYSRTGHFVALVEDGIESDKDYILIETARGRAIRMTDTFKKIEITTERHTVTIDDQNSHVTVDSQGDITIRALGKISIQGLAGVDIQGAMVKIN
jgi:uncharacterized protein involved in type VI secretion and phage assembly